MQLGGVQCCTGGRWDHLKACILVLEVESSDLWYTVNTLVEFCWCWRWRNGMKCVYNPYVVCILDYYTMNIHIVDACVYMHCIYSIIDGEFKLFVLFILHNHNNNTHPRHVDKERCIPPKKCWKSLSVEEAADLRWVHLTFGWGDSGGGKKSDEESWKNRISTIGQVGSLKSKMNVHDVLWMRPLG